VVFYFNNLIRNKKLNFARFPHNRDYVYENKIIKEK